MRSYFLGSTCANSLLCISERYLILSICSKFNREWNAKLDAKREAEFEKEKKVRAESEEAKANWNTQRDIRLKAKKDSNRSEEQVLQEQLESEAENLKTWERVSKLIDAAEGVDTKGSDTGRMRKLFIQLKNEPLEVTRGAAEAK